MLALALRLQPDAGFEKQIPLDHPYMKVFKQYEQAFGGANLISIAVMRKPGTAGDIYDAQFLDTLHKVTDDVFFLPGVDRSEEHTSELQSLMRISYAVFCLKKKTEYSNTNVKTKNYTRKK